MPITRLPAEPVNRDFEPTLKRFALAIGVLALVLFGYMATQRPSQKTLWGDEGTYVAMTASLARDFDLAFEEADRDWALERTPEKGVAVILQKVPGAVTYSKPVLYPLLAAPGYKVFGEPGMLILNFAGLTAGLFFGWVYMERIGGAGHAWLTTAVLAGASVMLPYLTWRMSEALQVGLGLTGAVLVCGALTSSSTRSTRRWRRCIEHPAAPLVGGACLGLLISMRFSNAALAGGVVLACLLMRRQRRAMAAFLGMVVALGLVLAATYLCLGTASPYTATRSSFNAQIGYPLADAGTEPAEALARFDERPATHRLTMRFSDTTLYSGLYFLIGRHTGLLAYFPLALVLLWALGKQRDKIGLAMLSGAAVLVLFYLLYIPNNYFGGSTFLGNRYFLVIYPALIVGLRRLPTPRTLLATAALALSFGVSAAFSVHSAAPLQGGSQTHTAAGLFRWLPYESTAVEMQGHRSRFWSRDYIRFTDPWPTVRTGHFQLHSDRRATEVMVAARLAREDLRFLVRPAPVPTVLEWADWRSSGRFEIPAGDPHDAPVQIQISPSRPWRQHEFWFQNDDPYEVRLIRLALRHEGGDPVSTEIFYLADATRLTRGWEREVLEASAPERATTGEADTVRVRVRNDSQTLWRRHDVLAVVAGYRLLADELELASRVSPMSADVAPGEEIELEIEVTWPETPGVYRLLVDLALHPVGWFSDRTGQALLDRTVRVEAMETD